MTAPSGIFSQQSSSAQITLTRDQTMDQGPLSVEFRTDPSAPPSTGTGEKTIPVATPGQQYLPVDETVTFQPGQATLAVTVPIVSGAANPGIVQVAITTTPLVTGGTTNTGHFAIVSGPDQLPLTITNAQIIPETSGERAIALTFNEPLSPTSVGNLENYRITPARGSMSLPTLSVTSRRRPSRHESPHSPPIPAPIGGALAAASLAQIAFLSAVGATYKKPLPPLPMRLQSATYDDATNTVTLLTKKPLNPSQVYQVVIGAGVGTPGGRKHNDAIGNLISQSGNPLAFGTPTFPAYPPGAMNLVDLTGNPFVGYFSGPTSFNVSNRSSGPPQQMPWSRPSNAPIKYTFSM
jgi:hypothetical protein